MRQMDDGHLGPPFLVLPDRVTIRRDEGVDVTDGVLHHARVAPELGWASIHELTPGARETRADFAVELEEDVRRAQQPELVHRVKLDGAAKLEQARAADERDVVEVNDVEAAGEDLADAAGLEERVPGLLGGERRQKAQRA